MNVLLVGAGGHAKAVVEAIEAAAGRVTAYVDPIPASWLTARRFDEDFPDFADGNPGSAVIGLGGTTVESLRRRLELARRYQKHGYTFPATVHPAAHVSASAHLDAGCVVLAGAVVQPGARIGQAAIINTGAIVEHDTDVGDGAHIAPGSVVLGGSKIGDCAMIGARATILPGAVVPPETLVPATKRYPA